MQIYSRFAGAIRIGANCDPYVAVNVACVVVSHSSEVDSGREKVHSTVQEGDFSAQDRHSDLQSKDAILQLLIYERAE